MHFRHGVFAVVDTVLGECRGGGAFGGGDSVMVFL